MSIHDELAALSSGQWVSVNDAKKALNLKEGFYSKLANLRMSERYAVSIQNGPDGIPLKYRAIDTAKLGAIELAKLRKSLGFSMAPEMFSLVGGKGL